MNGLKRAGVLAAFLLIGFHRFATPVLAADKLAEAGYFTLKDTEGNTVELESVLKSHKAVLLNFWAIWCDKCREEIPDLIRLQDQFKDRGFTVLGVDVDEPASKVKKFMTKKKMNYPSVLDEGGKVTFALGVRGIPTSFLLDPDGNILGKYHSAPPKLFKDVERALASSKAPAASSAVDFLD